MEQTNTTHMKRLSHIDDVNPDDIFIVRLNRLPNEFYNENTESMSRISLDCGFGRDVLASYLRGGRMPSANTLVRLCNYFNVSADWLLGLSNEKRAIWQ